MALALNDMLPTLYAQSIKLKNDFLLNLDVEAYTGNQVKRFNEDPENKFAQTETVYSSNPDNMTVGSMDMPATGAEKNIITNKDATVSITLNSDVLRRLKEFVMINISGQLGAFVNS